MCGLTLRGHTESLIEKEYALCVSKYGGGGGGAYRKFN